MYTSNLSFLPRFVLQVISVLSGVMEGDKQKDMEPVEATDPTPRFSVGDTPSKQPSSDSLPAINSYQIKPALEDR